MGLVDWIRPDAKCGHGRTRGYCSLCDRGVEAPARGAKRATDLRMSVQKTKKVKGR